jgi:hypothetical protein
MRNIPVKLDLSERCKEEDQQRDFLISVNEGELRNGTNAIRGVLFELEESRKQPHTERAITKYKI